MKRKLIYVSTLMALIVTLFLWVLLTSKSVETKSYRLPKRYYKIMYRTAFPEHWAEITGLSFDDANDPFSPYVDPLDLDAQTPAGFGWDQAIAQRALPALGIPIDPSNGFTVGVWEREEGMILELTHSQSGRDRR